MAKTSVTHPSATDGERPLRADAQRNRLRVLDEAERLFGTTGAAVRIEDVATAAGVGVGTVCRHFPTKSDLLAAVLERMYASVIDDARAALADPDPVGAFEGFVYRLTELHERRSVIAELTPGAPLPLSSSTRLALRSSIGELLARAQEAGGIRDDVSTADVLLLFAGIAHIGTIAETLGQPVRQRYVAVLLDGLRPLGASPLPGRALTSSDLDRLQPKRPGRARS